MNPSYILLLIYILDGMILKRNKFMLQWRKFEFKRSYICKDMGFLIFLIFLDFSKIYFDFLLIFKMQKRGFYLHRTRGADVALGTRTDVITRNLNMIKHDY